MTLTGKILSEYANKEEAIIPLLQMLQKEHGFVPKKDVVALSEETGIPLNRWYGVATFYSQFRMTPRGEHLIRVCQGTACHVSGAERVEETIRELIGLTGEGDTTEDGLFTIEEVACLGCCSLAPVCTIDGEIYGKLDRKTLKKVVGKYT